MWVGHKLGCQGNIQLLAVTTEAIKVGAGAITKLKSLEGAKNIVRNHEKTP